MRAATARVSLQACRTDSGFGRVLTCSLSTCTATGSVSSRYGHRRGVRASQSGRAKADWACPRSACPGIDSSDAAGFSLSHPGPVRHRLPRMRWHASALGAAAGRCAAGSPREPRGPRGWYGRDWLCRRSRAGQRGGKSHQGSGRALPDNQVVGTASTADGLCRHRAVGRRPELPVAAALPDRSGVTVTVRPGPRPGLCPRPARTH